ncbi:MAG TPA: helix-turn-helix domain-containing protein [Bryobacteraceae bacterium]|nr:helix-turn-helix domain-containing protein [Bryobacteraceae bacterium]
MKNSATAAEVKMGRPRGFDEDAALEAAMRVFWEKSYEGATIADLTEAMGINRSSMYTAFGDKESVFRRVIERYRQERLTYITQALAQPALREVVAGLIHGSVEFLTTPGNPRGCLLIQGALACGAEAEAVKQAMIGWRKTGEAAMKKRLQQAQSEGELSPEIQPADLARYLSSVMAGLGIQAANGATRTELRRVAEIALRCIETGLWGSASG